MAFDRYVNIAIHLFEHDDEHALLESLINQMEHIVSNYDIASIRMTFDQTYHNHITNDQTKRLIKLEDGTE